MPLQSPLKMPTICLQFIMFLSSQLLSPTTTAALINIDPGSVGIWVGDNGNTPSQPTTTPQSPQFGSNPADATTMEYRALQAWKSAITEDPKGILSSWNGPNVCSYRGIFCSTPAEDNNAYFSASTATVTSIDLNHANLKGTLVKDLSLLTHLTVLHLNSNRFTGTVPYSFSQLYYLTELDLSNNQLTGPFPTPTLLIPNLIYLDIRLNNFYGEVPDELFVKGLDAIFLNNNQFEGQIPMTLWASSASVITLANNKFTGTLPTTFGTMSTGIRELLFLNNKLTGCMPENVGYLSGLQVLDLSYNSFTGQLPSSLSCLTDIEVLDIAHNQLSGDLPELLCELKSLLNLSVAFNFFSGFSHDCVNLFFRNVGFDFSGNCIPGSGMQRPSPQCMGFPGTGGLSCLRIPTTKLLGCSGLPYTLGSSLPSTLP